MDQRLSKAVCILYIVCYNIVLHAQHLDYKSPEAFTLFNAKRKYVSAWQIEQLKKGVLVVRLDAQRRPLMLLLEQGDTAAAIQWAAQTIQKNKHRMSAFLNAYSFSKILFTYNYLTDSLSSGHTKGIFLDTNLVRIPDCELNASFYLLADEDYVFNSSIGFVPEDSVQYVTEHGTPVRKMAIVLKNKYGHQLKSPFPYFQKDRTLSKTPFTFPYVHNPEALFYIKLNSNVVFPKRVTLEKSNTPERQWQIVYEWNIKLHEYYERVKSSPQGNMQDVFKAILY